MHCGDGAAEPERIKGHQENPHAAVMTSSGASRVYFDTTTAQFGNLRSWPTATENTTEFPETPGERARQKLTGALIIGGLNQMTRQFRASWLRVCASRN